MILELDDRLALLEPLERAIRRVRSIRGRWSGLPVRVSDELREDAVSMARTWLVERDRPPVDLDRAAFGEVGSVAYLVVQWVYRHEYEPHRREIRLEVQPEGAAEPQEAPAGGVSWCTVAALFVYNGGDARRRNWRAALDRSKGTEAWLAARDRALAGVRQVVAYEGDARREFEALEDCLVYALELADAGDDPALGVLPFRLPGRPVDIDDTERLNVTPKVACWLFGITLRTTSIEPIRDAMRREGCEVKEGSVSAWRGQITALALGEPRGAR
jgi:hypothetical protein